MAGLTRRARHRMPSRSHIIIYAVMALLVSAQTWSALQSQRGETSAQSETASAQSQTAVVEQQRDATAAQASLLAEQIKAACRDADLAGPVCQQADQVAAEPVPGPQGPPPSAEEISRAVADYLAANPPPAGRPPSAAEVAAAVAVFLTANPPTPGRPPTAAEIAVATEVYFAANPPPPGRDGEPGRPPTAEEIRAVVDAYMAEHPPAAGPTGDQGPKGDPGEEGPQGVGVLAVTTDRSDVGCFLVFTLTDSSERRVQVADVVCRDPALVGVG